MGLSWGRRLGLGVLAALLLVTLISANLVVGVDRTVLDAEFVTESLESEDVYAIAVDEMRAQLASRGEAGPAENGEREAAAATGGGAQVPGSDAADMARVLDRVVTPAYLQSQVEANVVRLYDYLHGREDELVLEIDLVPVKERLAPEMTAMVTGNLSNFDPTLAAMAESDEAFVAEREAFTAQQLERIQAETDEELSEAELRARYDEQRPEIRRNLIDELVAAQESDTLPDELDAALVGLAVVRVDGLVASDSTHESFTRDLDVARDDLNESVEATLTSEIDDALPDRMDLAENVDPEAASALESLRSGVSIVGTLTYVLPLLALSFAGLIHRGTRTRSGGLLLVGTVTALSGLGWVAGLTMAQQALTTEIEASVGTGALDPVLVSAFHGAAGGLFDVFFAQSWMLFGLGTVLVGGGVGLRRGLIPVPDWAGGTEVPDRAGGTEQRRRARGTDTAPGDVDIDGADGATESADTVLHESIDDTDSAVSEETSMGEARRSTGDEGDGRDDSASVR